MSARVLRTADYRRMRWKNGGGWTTELAASASTVEGGNFDWRISIAEIESDGAFSTFPGCDRYIALLDGPGMELQFDAAEPVRLDQRLRFVRFDGEAKTFGRHDACQRQAQHQARSCVRRPDRSRQGRRA